MSATQPTLMVDWTSLIEVFLGCVWLYVRFTLSYRDVEDLLAERALDV